MQYFVQIITILCWLLIVAMLIRSVLSWFSLDPNNILVNIVHTITEPMLAPLRRILPRLEVIDLSPMVAIILLYVIIWALSRAS
jgi:YggT family protein